VWVKIGDTTTMEVATDEEFARIMIGKQGEVDSDSAKSMNPLVIIMHPRL